MHIPGETCTSVKWLHAVGRSRGNIYREREKVYRSWNMQKRFENDADDTADKGSDMIQATQNYFDPL